MENIYDDGPSNKITNSANIYYIDLDSKTMTLADHISAIKTLSDFSNTTVPIYFYFIGFNCTEFKDFGVSYLCNYIKQLSTNNVFEACNIVIRGNVTGHTFISILDTEIPTTVYSDTMIYTLPHFPVTINKFKEDQKREFTIVL